MADTYVDETREYFSEGQVERYVAWLRRQGSPLWRTWFELLSTSRCPTCSVLLWVPYRKDLKAHEIGKASVTHEIGCPIG